MSLSVYGIPTCSSCKKARSWLKEQGVEHTWINTRENPPQRQEIEEWISSVGSKPMKNTSGGSYRALGEEKKTWSDAQWAQAFADDAMLLKRPLFTRNGKALCTGFRGSDEEKKHRLGIS
jgi:arsenate reductase (glutaredoxin)